MTNIQIAFLVGLAAVALLFALCGYMIGFWRGLGHALKEVERDARLKRGLSGGR